MFEGVRDWYVRKKDEGRFYDLGRQLVLEMIEFRELHPQLVSSSMDGMTFEIGRERDYTPFETLLRGMIRRMSLVTEGVDKRGFADEMLAKVATDLILEVEGDKIPPYVAERLRRFNNAYKELVERYPLKLSD